PAGSETDPGCALSREEARARGGGLRGPGGAGAGRSQLPLPAPLPGAPSAGAGEPAPGGPPDPPAHPLPRSHRKKDRSPDMNLVELDNALRKLRLSGMADALETRLRQAQTEKMAPIDLASALVSDELLRRQDRLFERRTKQARFRDPERTLDSFDFDFNRKM